jgi:magnesium-transporting ATPase (P-type)
MGEKKPQTEADDAFKEPAHSLTFEDVIKLLSTDAENGLSKSEADRRNQTYGENALDEGPGVQPIKILVHQVANALTLVRLPT